MAWRSCVGRVMSRYLLVRFAQGLGTLFAITLVVFFLSRLTGDPLSLIMDPHATQADYARERARLGLDKMYIEQYLIFLANAVRGDFGESIFFKAPAFEVVLEKLPATLELGGIAILLSAAIAVPVGVMSAVKKGGLFDRAAQTFALAGQSAPIFWVGIVLISIFAVKLGWLPTSGRGTWSQLVLPAITLGWYGNAFLMRITRSGMLTVLDTEYIKLARLAGIPESKVIWKYGLKSAATSIITTFGLLVISLVTGAVVTETVFAWPGVGRLIVESILQRDFPVVQGITLAFAIMVVLVYLTTDVLHALLDPRVRFD